MSEPTAAGAASSEEQSPGTDPRSKRNSGLFAFFKWFRLGSRESIGCDSSRSSSLESVASDKSSGTVASFHFVPPNAYENKVLEEKQVPIGPETDTYKARLKQRDKRRETDKNVTLRKKYNLFFNRETLLRPQKPLEDDENSKSLPLMTRAHIAEVEPQKVHRRTNSESSKMKRAGAYVHVKGKRKAPQPPRGGKLPVDNSTSLKRKKRTAPVPPPKLEVEDLTENDPEIEVLANDYLKLDHGVLKPVKEDSRPKTPQDSSSTLNLNALTPTSSRTSVVEAPISPRPWYKRNSVTKETLTKKENKYEPIERLPEVQFTRNSTLDLTLEDVLGNPEKEKKKDDKRKSGLSFLTNISELDREASEIMKIKADYERTLGSGKSGDIPEFMKPKDIKLNPNDSWVSPRRISARDLIAKFNAITNVSKVSVFGVSQKEKYFGKQTSLDEARQRQEQLLQSHKKIIENIDKKKEDRFSPLMKSESASAVKLGSCNESIPKIDKKNWKCPKCNLENEYWRIICHVCSTIKPYFDDFASSSKVSSDPKSPEIKPSSPIVLKKEPPLQTSLFERSKTQIGFSALASYNAHNKLKTGSPKNASDDRDRSKVDDTSKKEERERLKKMLIEMKNSLPKRKSNMLMKQSSRSSIIIENPEETKTKQQTTKSDEAEKSKEKTQEEKVAEILIGTTQMIYENIRVRKTENPKPIKVSSSAQTSAAMKQIVPESSLKKLIEDHKANSAYEPMKLQDFEDIYSDKNGKGAARIYANLAQNDELSLFFNVPKNVSNLENNSGTKGDNSVVTKFCVNTDTIEINRLLRRLETAIAKGDMTEAAIFAKELAQLKVNCSVIRQKPQSHSGKHTGFQVEMYVEDKVSHRGPFPIDVTETQTVAELKEQISKEFEIPVEVQRWILGKELVVDDNTTLKDHKITEGCPVFLYLVAPDKKPRETDKPTTSTQPSAQDSKLAASDEQIPPKLNVNIISTKDENDIDSKIVEIKQEKHMENKPETSKIKTEAPKIVNVIPKSSEPNPPKAESVCVIPIQNEPAILTNNKIASNNPAKTFSNRPISTTEIKVVIRPYSSRYHHIPNDSKEEKAGLVRAKSMQVEAFQAPLVTPKPQENLKKASPPMSSNRTSAEAKDIRAEVIVSTTSVNEDVEGKSSSSKTTLMIPKTAIPTTSGDSRIPETSLYPNMSKVSARTHGDPDLEVYDVNTLKPKKEWECHLCTLLNPESTNICAVCATIRVKKTSIKRSNKKKPAPQPQKDQTYLQLVNLDSADLVPNADVFECVVCFMEVGKGVGVTLRECLHQFCRDCLARTVEFAEDAEVKCPYRDEEYSCNIALQDREIKALVSPTVYEQYLAKSVAQAENQMDKTFHCKTPDCKGWCIFEDNVNEFRCPVCRKTNCLTCQAIHMGANCKQYQERMKDESSMSEEAKRTKDFLEEMVEKGEAIACPTCKVILMKKWGCDWLRCSMCKTEICWVTRGPRWGPAGKGDTSGGCQCGLNGVKCHPKCNYCH